MRLNRYDQPVLAVINAANNLVGQTVHAVYFRDEWRAQGGGDGKMWDALDLVAECHPEAIQIIYQTKPCSYVEVFIKVLEPIRLMSK